MSATQQMGVFQQPVIFFPLHPGGYQKHMNCAWDVYYQYRHGLKRSKFYKNK
jgi:hypothetical protein